MCIVAEYIEMAKGFCETENFSVYEGIEMANEADSRRILRKRGAPHGGAPFSSLKINSFFYMINLSWFNFVYSGATACLELFLI